MHISDRFCAKNRHAVCRPEPCRPSRASKKTGAIPCERGKFSLSPRLPIIASRKIHRMTVPAILAAAKRRLTEGDTAVPREETVGSASRIELSPFFNTVCLIAWKRRSIAWYGTGSYSPTGNRRAFQHPRIPLASARLPVYRRECQLSSNLPYT